VIEASMKTTEARISRSPLCSPAKREVQRSISAADRRNASKRNVVGKIHAMTEPGPSRAVNVIILYIRGQGNGRKGTEGQGTKRAPFYVGPIMKMMKVDKS